MSWQGLMHHTAWPPLPEEHSHLPPFALCQAFPGSDYYGGSVTVELALRRRSRFCAPETYRVRVGAPLASLPCSLPGTHRRELSRVIVYHSLYTVSPLQGCCDGCRISPLEARVQPIQASPCAQDLRNRSTYIPSGISALPACSFPLRVSLPGGPVVLGGIYALNLLPL
jgi:hypothetical protein